MRRLAPAAAIIAAIIAVGWLIANLQPLHRAPAGLGRVIAAEAIAKRKWGHVCNGQPIVIRRGSLPPGRLAQASYQFAADTQDRPAGYFNCVLTVTPGHIAWPKFCTAIQHEWLHLRGYRAPPGQEFIRPDGSLDHFHSRNKNSLMYPTLLRIPRSCRGPEPA